MKKGIVLLLVCMLVAVGFVACSSGGGGGGGGGVTVDNSKASGTFSIFSIDATTGFSVDRGTVTFDGAGHGTYASLVSADSGTFTYTVTVPGNAITINGTLVGTMNAAGNFFAAVDVSAGQKVMMSGVKNSLAFTETSAIYVGGDFQYNSGTSGELFSVVTATPSAGFLLYTSLSTTGTGTTDYALASNGTFTIDPSKLGGPDTFGAITGDKNILMFGDAEAIISPMQSVAVALKLPGFGMTLASLNGTYKAYEFMGAGTVIFDATRYRLTFNGSGGGTWTVEASSIPGTDSGTFAYTMNSDGTLNIDGFMDGVALQDGSVLSLMSTGVTAFIAIKQ